ncbi:MAG TPA: tetratricopeptide repeat protein [Longimicrobiales bacterium]
MSDIQLLIDGGKQAFESGDYGAALTNFQEVLRLNPDFADIHHLSGLCLSFLGHADAALQEFDQAITLNDRYIEAHLNRAITLNELGRFEEAQQAFAHAAEFEMASQGRFPSAVSARLANGHASLGDLYLEAGAPVEAAEQYRRGLDIRPLFHDLRVGLAQALLQTGDLPTAASELRLVLEANPRFLAARLDLGLVYFRLKQVDAARQQWELAHEQQPSNAQARAYLAMLERKVTPDGGTTD